MCDSAAALAFWASTSPAKTWVLFSGGTAVARREDAAAAASAAKAHLARAAEKGALRVAWAVRGGAVVASFPSVPGVYVRARGPGDAAAAVAAVVADAARGEVAGVASPRTAQCQAPAPPAHARGAAPPASESWRPQ